MNLPGTSHVNYLVIKKFKIAEQKGSCTPNPTREQEVRIIHSLAGAAGSNPAGGVEVLSLVSVVCCVLTGTGLCTGPIPPPEESYRVWCESLSVIRCNNNTLNLQCVDRKR